MFISRVAARILPEYIIIQKLENPCLQCHQVIFRHDVAVVSVFEVANFGRVSAFLRYHRQAEIERLVQSQSDVPGNGTNIGHFEYSADLKVLRVVDLTKVERGSRVHAGPPFLLHSRADDHQSDVTSLYIPEDLNQVIYTFATTVNIHSARKQDYFSKRNAEFAFDVLFRFRHLRKIAEVNRVVRR